MPEHSSHKDSLRSNRRHSYRRRLLRRQEDRFSDVDFGEFEQFTPKIFGISGLVFVGLFGAVLTLLISAYVNNEEHGHSQLRFDSRVGRLESAIQNRMETYIQVLRSGVAAFHASENISRDEWRDYVKSLETDKVFPGIQGIGFAKWLKPEELDAHIEEVRAEGFPDYKVWPEGPRAEYTSIVYLEPFDFRNKRAFGYDMYSQPTRRAAMDRARDDGIPAVSGKVILKQETDQDVQYGFLTYLPLYRNAAPLNSVADRRAALLGYVYSPFRMNDFMRGVLGGDEVDIGLSIYDGGATSEVSLMYHSADEVADPEYSNTRTIDLNGHLWTLKVTSLPAFDQSIHGGTANIVQFSGLVITLLIIAVMRTMAATGSRAVSLAKTMTTALRASEHQFRQAFETAPHGMALVAPDGDWLMVNDALCRIVGYDEGELVRMKFQEITHPDDVKSHVEFVRRMLDGDISTYQVEKRYVRKDGKIVPILLSAGLVRDSQGQPLHLISQILDLTDTKDAQQQLWQAQKMEAVGQLTGGLAHDFNNLLAVILGNLQLLERHIKKDETASRRAAAAMDAARRGADLTHRLLAFSRRQVLEAKSVSPNELIYGMGELLKGTLGEKVELQINPYDDNWVARIDPHQLETAILNLAVNARDAMPNGGHLTIEAKSVYLDRNYAARHTEVEPGEYIALSVSDTGQGIPADLVDKVFQPFFTTKDVDKGTGLGLSMVYGFAKQSGGHIDIYSEEGIGTTITLYLPRETKLPAEAPAVQAFSDEIPHGTETVLVVEDNPAVLEMVVTMLKELGYTILQAGTGATALLLLASRDIDVLLTDIVMAGGMSGDELANTAKSRFPNLRIVYTSGFAETAVRRRDKMHAGSAMLKKPFTRQELAWTIRNTLDRRKKTETGSDMPQAIPAQGCRRKG